MKRFLFLAVALATAPLPAFSQSSFTHFEARHTYPLEITPDGARILAVNSLEGRLSVFMPGTQAVPAPLLIAEIPVGHEPVTVRAASSTIAWVVNELSDSISIVDLNKRAVVRTLRVPDEPADVVFAGGRAFVSCGRANEIAVFDTVTFSQLGRIPLQGVFPRALAVSPDTSRVYAAFLLSGNNTTVVPFRQAPLQPSPVNSALPPPPQTALIVPDSDPRIAYDVLDHDLAEIDTASLAVTRYHEGAGTNITALAVQPDGALWAAALEARNLIRFEPALNGVFSESRVAKFASDAAAQITNLNPTATTVQVPAAIKEQSLAQPMALLPDAERSSLWLAAFGSDRLAELDSSGAVLRRIELRRPGTESTVRGPRGLAKLAQTGHLVVLNKLSDTLSVVSANSGAVLAEVPVSSHDPMPAAQREGRGKFFDSRLSGNGTVSCGACHLDADNDGMAWDLGDPGGEMLTLTGYAISIGEPWAVDRPAHPMKGPMVTQSLRGIRGTAPFHWRGDKQRLQDFNGSFAKLQGGSLLSDAEMDKVAAYIESLRNHPNPNRNPDNSLKPVVAGGDPARGRQLFEQLNVCSKCHTGPRGTNHVLDEFTSVLTQQPVKNATLEHSYKKVFLTPQAATSLSGFGFTHDGSGSRLPRGHEYDQDRFRLYENAERDVTAYVLSFETDTPPAAAESFTVSRDGTAPAEDPAALRAVMETQATAGRCDLMVEGIIGGIRRSYLFDTATGLYLSDSAAVPPQTFASLLIGLQTGESLTLLGVTAGSGRRRAIDRDGDGILNADEPLPELRLFAAPLRLDWEPSPDLFPELSNSLQSWTPLQLLPSRELPAANARSFFRLTRTW